MNKYLEQSNKNLERLGNKKHSGGTVIDENIEDETFDDPELDQLESVSQIGEQAPAPMPPPKPKKKKSRSKTPKRPSRRESKAESTADVQPSEASVSQSASFVQSAYASGVPETASRGDVSQVGAVPPEKGGKPPAKIEDINKPTYGAKSCLPSLSDLTSICGCLRNRDYHEPEEWQDMGYANSDNWNPYAEFLIEDFYEDEAEGESQAGPSEQDASSGVEESSVMEGEIQSEMESKAEPEPGADETNVK